MSRHLKFIQALAFTISTLVAILVLWMARGYLVREEAASEILHRQGYHGEQIRKVQVWFTVASGCRGEAAKYEGTAIARSGMEVPVMVCVDWPWGSGWAAVTELP